MAGKRVLLTLNPRLYTELQKIADSNYMNVQELITDVLRKDILKFKSKIKKKKVIKNEK